MDSILQLPSSYIFQPLAFENLGPFDNNFQTVDLCSVRVLSTCVSNRPALCNFFFSIPLITLKHSHRRLRCNDFCRLHCAAMMTSTFLSIPGCCPSMIYAVFLCDARHPLFLAVWSSAAYRNDRHGRTMIICDAWRLPIKVPDVRRRYWPVAIRNRMWCSK